MEVFPSVAAATTDAPTRMVEAPAGASWRPRLARLALWLGALVASAWFVLRIGVMPIVPGGDPSGTWAVNQAIEEGRRFGRDIVWTLGPHGYLVDAVGVGHTVHRRAVGEVALVMLWAVAALLHVENGALRSAWARLLAAMAILYAGQAQAPDYRWFCLVVVLALVGRREGRRARAARLLAGTVAGFLLMVKLSLGFGSVGLVIAAAVLSLPWHRALRRAGEAAAAAVTGAAAGWLVNQGTLAGLFTYLRVGAEATRGYGSGASSSPPAWGVAAVAIAIFVLAVVGWCLALKTRQARNAAVVLTVALLVTARHAMVRQDSHLRLFTAFGIFVVVLLAVEAASRWPPSRIVVAVEILLVPLLVVWFRPESAPDRALGFQDLLGVLESPGQPVLVHELSILTHPAARERLLAEASAPVLASRRLSPALRARIGDATVDVYPTEHSYVPANGLRWANRPMLSSYLAYTPALDGLDAAFLASPRRPQLVLWHPSEGPPMTSIDNRHLFWDEPLALRALLDGYRLVAEDGDLLLLGRRADHRWGPPRPLERRAVDWGAWTAVPAAPGVVLAEVHFHRGLVPALVRSVFREEASFLSVRLASGEERTFRVVPDQMPSGIWISPLPLATADLRALLSGSDDGPRVMAIRLHGGTFGRLADRVEVRWLQLAPAAAAAALTASH